MSDSKKQGWVRLHRKIEDNFLWFSEPFTKAQAWVDLFLNANHKDGIVHIRGNIVKIKRGQIGWSELTMSKRWKWSRNKVRGFLKLLENEQQIKQQKDRYITSITTILEYETFQNEQQKVQQKDSRRYINKNVKNEKKDIASASADKTFNSFWKGYPKKEKKKQAYDIWKRKKLSEHIEEINAFVLRAKKTERWQKGFVKQPTTFLNGECWNDDLTAYGENKGDFSC